MICGAWSERPQTRSRDRRSPSCWSFELSAVRESGGEMRGAKGEAAIELRS